MIKYNKSETVSSIGILGACHIAQNKGERSAFHIHLSPSNSVELFPMMLVTVNIQSEIVSSIGILGAYHLASMKGEKKAFHMHLSPFNSVELCTIMLVTINNKI